MLLLQELQDDIKREYPAYRMLPKSSSTLMRRIDVFLKVITLWKMRGFMTDFITTIGYTVYVPSSWALYPEYEKMVILRHERVHMRQRAKYGPVLFSFLYLFFPLPCFFAYFRMKFEQEAYAESLRALVELLDSGRSMVQMPVLREQYIGFFTGASYFWTWPWRVRLEKWFDGAVKAALR
jgi:hypothetical protein